MAAVWWCKALARAKHGDNWLFFYHVFMERPARAKLPKEAVEVSDTIFSATGECWPNFQMLTW